jgi:hypothetical protein
VLRPVSDSPLNWLDTEVDWTDPGPRFVIEGQDDGTFTVIDRLTDTPAVWNDQMLFNLSFDEADDFVESMNLLVIDMRRN